MKSEINCPILNNEKFSKEVLTDIINSLEQLENTKNTIFNRLNNAFSERVNKLCNLKSRINRANQIILSYSSINEALTLKSKYHYPSKKHNFYTPTIIDPNASSINKVQTQKLNKIVLNEKSNLGSKSLAAKDKIVIYDKYLSFATQFNDIVNELNMITSQEINVRQSLDEFEPILTHVTNDFTFGTKMKIEYAKKQQYNPQQEFSRGSTVLQDYLNEKKAEEEKRKRAIQQAPMSIIQKIKIKRTKPKRNKIKTLSKINVNLPTNIGLGGVADLAGVDDEEEKFEEKNEEEDEEEDDDFQDDVQNDPQLENQDEETDMPIDYIRYNNKNKIDLNKNIQTSQNINNNNYQKAVYNNPNNNVNNLNNNIINTTPNQIQSNSVPVSPSPEVSKSIAQPPPQINRVPNPPPVVPSSNPIKIVSGNAGGGVPPPPPPPPPPPVLQVVPVVNKIVEKKNDGPELSLEEELAKAMSGLKKKVEFKPIEKPKQLSFTEQLAMSRNKLKKPVITSKPKPSEPKLNPKDLLSQQIKLRFQNLRKHEEENEDSDESDSFDK